MGNASSSSDDDSSSSSSSPPRSGRRPGGGEGPPAPAPPEVVSGQVAESPEPEDARRKSTRKKSPVQPYSKEIFVGARSKKKARTYSKETWDGARPTKKARKEKEGSTAQKRNARTWEQSYAELVKFHAIRGHCKVPQTEQWSRLHRWTYMQKRRFHGSCGSMGPDQKSKLDAIGFDWTIKKPKTFDEYYEELAKFKAEHNHCDVPQSGKWQSLGNWLNRAKHRRFGSYIGCRQLTREEIEMLGSIGVVWPEE